MANYQILKADIDAKVYQNGAQEITGANLNSVLNAMVTTLGAEYQFAGVATTATNPGSPDAKAFYIANGKGTYTNFGGINVTEDEVVVLYWDTAWHKEATGIASQAKLTELESKVNKIVGGDIEVTKKDSDIPVIDDTSWGYAEDAVTIINDTSRSGGRREIDLNDYIGKKVRFSVNFNGSDATGSPRIMFALVNELYERPSNSGIYVDLQPVYERIAFSNRVENVWVKEFVVPETYTKLLTSYKNVSTEISYSISIHEGGIVSKVEKNIIDIENNTTAIGKNTDAISLLNTAMSKNTYDISILKDEMVKIEGGDIEVKKENDELPIIDNTTWTYASDSVTIIQDTATSGSRREIDLSGFVGKVVKFVVDFNGNTPYTTSKRIVFALVNNESKRPSSSGETANVQPIYEGNAFQSSVDGIWTKEFVVPVGYARLLTSYTGSSTKISYSSTIHKDGIKEQVEKNSADIVELKKENGVVYVSPSGNDGNDGSFANPLATLQKAASVSNNIIMRGGVYTSGLNCTQMKDRVISIRAYSDELPFIKMGTEVVNNGSEAKESGYTNVYSVSLESIPSTQYPTALYQHMVADVNSLIADADIHPMQKGYMHRLDCTKIMYVSKSTLAETLAYIDSQVSSNNYYYTYNNGKLYFSRPQASSSEHPIIMPTGQHAIYNYPNNPNNVSLKVYGIAAYYGNMEVKFTDNSEFVNCVCKYCYSYGNFRWVSCKNLKFIKCEAARTQYGNYSGDGFNGSAANYSALVPTKSSIYLIDGWSHDNQDDGYSDHDGCIISLYGGLYEYNGKGVTPSYGSHAFVMGVESRYNRQQGFRYVGNLGAQDHGDPSICGNAKFVNCYAKGNQASGFMVEGMSADESKPNYIVCEDCTSIDNSTYGYENKGSMLLRNCKAKGNGSNAVYGNPSVDNAEIVA